MLQVGRAAEGDAAAETDDADSDWEGSQIAAW